MRWITPPPLTSTPFPDFQPLIAETLIRRGIRTSDAARAFIDPDSYIPTLASALPGMDAAAARVHAAIARQESICIWGDFDVDGQTSTAVLYQTLLALGADVIYHIPVRGREGHGVNVEYLAPIIERGTKLILTCDTGITAHAAVDYANTRGVDVVITDHHDLPVTTDFEAFAKHTDSARLRNGNAQHLEMLESKNYFLPNAKAITDPKLLPEDHPLATLAGVGVAYKLSEALLARSSSPLHPSSLLDLTALGLIADLALLKGDARYLVQKGLAQLRVTERVGLKALMGLAELNAANLTEEHIGFQIAPRLNALGRLGDANPAVELLTTQDAGRARVIATQLEGFNAERQFLTNQVTQAAEAQLRADPSLLTQPIIILAHAGWPGGVVGIAAARLVERYGKPAILMKIGDDGMAHGSARSVNGLHITKAIAAQSDLLANYGGHPMAAGLGLSAENLDAFRRRMNKTVEKMLGEAVYEEAALVIDGWLTLPEANLDLAGQFEKLAPYGPGNEKLVIAARALTMKGSMDIGKNRDHRKLTVEDANGNMAQVLWWNGTGEPLPEGKFDLAFTLRASDFRGTRQAQLEFVDYRLVEAEKIEVKSKRIEVDDWRGAVDASARLSIERESVPTIVWAEGPEKKNVNALDRQELTQSDTLIIWTTPPAPEILHAALDKVKPRKVILVANDPNLDESKAFLERLAGLVKFVLNQKNGQTTLAELAAATSQTEAVIRLGLQWLMQRNQIAGRIEPVGTVALAAVSDHNERTASAETFTHLQNILKETAAYRAHFRRADANTLVNYEKNS